MERPKRKRSAAKEAVGTIYPATFLSLFPVKIKFTSLKAPKIDTTLAAPPSQTFHALKTRLAEETKLNPLAIRFLFKNKAISDSKSVLEVFGQTDEAQVTVMVMKNIGATSTTTTATVDGEKMEVENYEFWESVRKVIEEKFKGAQDKDEVFAALKRGYQEKFGSA